MSDIEYDPDYSRPIRSSPWAHLSHNEDLEALLNQSNNTGVGGTYWEAEDLIQPSNSKLQRSQSGHSSPRSPRSPGRWRHPRSPRSTSRSIAEESGKEGSVTSSPTASVTSKMIDPLSPYAPSTPFPPLGGYRLFPVRWLVLTLFSVLSFMNRVICFSYAPVTHEAEEFYNPPIHLSWLIDIFFVVYAIIALPSARIVDRIGLRTSVIICAWIQAIGAAIRLLTIQDHESEKFYVVFTGQIVAAASQGVFLNAPPLLSALWFGEDERTIATTVSVVANTLGIAGAYLLAPMIVQHPSDIVKLNETITLICVGLALCTIFFPNAPPIPPTRSIHIKEALPKIENMKTLIELIRKKGYLHTVLMFSASESILNTISTYMHDMLHSVDASTDTVGWVGVGFISVGIISAALFGWAVDRSKFFKTFGLLCCAGTSAFMLAFAIHDSTNSAKLFTVVLLLIGVGFFVAPMEPIAVEIAAECTFPASENTFTALMQISGNVMAAAMIPLVLALGNINRANWMIFGMSIITTVLFATFNGEYLRSEREETRKLLDDEGKTKYDGSSKTNKKISSDNHKLPPLRLPNEEEVNGEIYMKTSPSSLADDNNEEENQDTKNIETLANSDINNNNDVNKDNDDQNGNDNNSQSVDNNSQSDKTKSPKQLSIDI